MTDLTAKMAPIGSIDTVMLGEAVTVHYRAATHRELIDVRYETMRLNTRLREAEVALSSGHDVDLPTGADVLPLIAWVARIVTDITPLTPTWAECDAEERIQALDLIDETVLWRLVALASRGLSPVEKKDSNEPPPPTSPDPAAVLAAKD